MGYNLENKRRNTVILSFLMIMLIIGTVLPTVSNLEVKLDSDNVNPFGKSGTRSVNDVEKWGSVVDLFPQYDDFWYPAVIEYNGNLYVAWATRDQTIGTGGDLDIVIANFNGIGWSSAQELSSSSDSGDDEWPAMSVYNNKLYIVWEAYNESDSEPDILIRSFDGNSWSPIYNLSEVGVPTWDRLPDMCVYDNKLYVTYTTGGGTITDGLDYDIIVKSFDGSSWSNWEEVTPIGDSGIDIKSQIVEYDNQLCVVWETDDNTTSNGTDRDIVVRFFDGLSWSAISEITYSIDNVTSIWPDVCVYEDRLYFTWYNSLGGSSWDVLLRVYDGLSWESIITLSETGNNLADMIPQLEIYDNNLFVSWHHHPNASIPNDTLIKIRLFNGSSWSEIVNATPIISVTGDYNIRNWLASDENRLWFICTNTTHLWATNYDSLPPTFSGINNTIDNANSGNITLTWNTSSDPSTPITYNIFMSTTSGSYDFSTSNYTTQNLYHTITGLENGQEYFFIVRAEDNRSNEDNNTVERSAIPTTTDDDTPPTFSGLKNAINRGTDGKVFLNWSEATDPDTVESNMDPSLPITYNIYMATSSGGHNFSSPNYTTQNLNYTVTGLTNKQTYYFVVRAEDSAGNEETNNAELNATPTTPPTIQSHSPTANNVLANSTILIEFSEYMNHTSVEGLFSISPTATIESFAWSGRNLTVTFSSNLSLNTTYEVTTGADAIDIYGIRLGSDFSWSFKIEADLDGDGTPNSVDDDDDGDGMPDEWEMLYGLDPKNLADANEDADNDGYTNLDEYKAGTDPLDDSDHPSTGSSMLLWMALVAALVVIVVVSVIWLKRKNHSEGS